MRKKHRIIRMIPWLALGLLSISDFAILKLDADDQISQALEAINKVDKNGVGNEQAVQAMKVLNSAPASALPQILSAMDQANTISQNWIRSAVVSITRQSDKLPVDQIQAYFNDQSHSPMGRLLAFDLLTGDDPKKLEIMVPALIDDASMPLRRKAVAQLIDQADETLESDPTTSLGKLGYALSNARDVGQIQTIAKTLKKLGVTIDLRRQLGFVDQWHLVGTFDNKQMEGFDVEYGPEKSPTEIDLTATYQGINDSQSNWKKITTSHETGVVDLNELIGKQKGAIVYAYGTVSADEDQSMEIRIGTPNATKIWLNGELVMENEIYHNSNSIDKFRSQIKLKKGENQILIKVCQNEQTQPWAQDWKFQLRICDKNGTPLQVQ